MTYPTTPAECSRYLRSLASAKAIDCWDLILIVLDRLDELEGEVS